MKGLIFLVIFCILYTNNYGQIQNGLVREQNSGKRPVGGVTVRFDDAVPTTSDDNGIFRLVFEGKKAGDLIFKREIQKMGYELVNGKDLEVIKVSSTDILGEDIILAKAGMIDAARKEYYGVSDKALLASFNKEKKAIEAQLQKAQINQSQYAEQFNILQKQYDLQEQFLDSLAGKFARINFDDVSELYKEAFDLFKSGKIGEAIQKLEGADLIGLANEILKEEERIAKEKKMIIEGIKLQAQLYVLNLESKKAEAFYDQALRLDSNNLEILQDFADFLRGQNQIEKAILHYNKLLKITKADEQRATIYNQLGNLFRSQQKMDEAEIAFSEALKLFKELNQINRDQFLPHIAWTLNNTGNYYRSDNKWEKAETYFFEALRIFRQLNEIRKDEFLPHIALTLNNLGNCYFNNKDSRNNMLEAKNAYNESLDIYQKLADNNPGAIVPKDIQTFFDLKITYGDNSKSQYSIMYEYELILLKALKTHRQLSEKRPNEFLPFVALTLNNLGNLYKAKSEYEKAEKAYQEALKIHSDFAIKNSDAFSPFVASTLISLGEYYYSRNNLVDCEKAYVRALDIYQSMNNRNPNTFLTNIASVYNNLGELKAKQKEYDKALYYYGEAIRFRKQVELERNNDFYKDWRKLNSNINDINYVISDSTLRIQANKLRIQSDSNAARKYTILARKALFSSDFEITGRALNEVQRLTFKPVETKIIRAHYLLLYGRYKDAKEAYILIKDLQDDQGNLISKVCLDDLALLEKAGITNKHMLKIIDLLKK